MAFEIDDLLKEINKFKSNVTSSNDLVSKIEDAINSVKNSTKETVTTLEDHIKNTKNTIDEIEDTTKKNIVSAKDLLIETKEKFSMASSDIIEKCESIVNNSKETSAKIAKAIEDIDGNVNKFQMQLKKEKRLLTASIITIGLISIATLIISILSLVR